MNHILAMKKIYNADYRMIKSQNIFDRS